MIRKAHSTESEIISKIAFESKAYWGYSDEFMVSCKDELTYSIDMFSKPEYHFFVKETDKKVVGFSCVTENSIYPLELEALFIDPTYIKQGVGSELFNYTIQFAKENYPNQEIFVQSDPYAEPFYLKMGGEIVGKKELNSIPGRYLKMLKFSC